MAGSQDSAVSKKKGVAEATPALCLGALMPSSYHGTSLRTPFFFLLVDSFVLSPWFPESVLAASLLPASVLAASVVLAVPKAVVLLVSVPVATAASPLAAAAGGAYVDSPAAAELDSGGVAVVGALAVPGALFSGAVPAPVVPDGTVSSAGAL